MPYGIKSHYKSKQNISRAEARARRYPRKAVKGAVRGKSVSSSDYKSKSAKVLFPPLMNVPFTYVDDLNLSPAAGAISAYQYRGNSLFDPDLSGVGSQPRYFDTLLGASGSTAPYAQYCVLAAKAEVFLRNVSSVFMMASITMAAPGVTVPSSLGEARERQDTVVRQIAPQGSGGSQAKLQMYRKTNSILGIKDTMDSDDAKALHNANPANPWVITIQAYNPDGLGVATIRGNIRITYYSKLSVVNDVADS